MKKELLRIENLKKGTLLKGVELQVFEGEIIHCVFDNIQAKSLFFEIVTGAVGGYIMRSKKSWKKMYSGY